MGWPLPEGAVLGVLAERPSVEFVGPLAEGFGPEVAAEIHEAMLLDVLDSWGSDRVLAPGGRRVVVFAPDDAGPWFDARVPDAFALQPGAPGGLGPATRAFLAGEIEDGATRVVVVGADAPALDPAAVVSAFLALESRDVVLGPASDGGVYLVGCRNEVPPIFDSLHWGEPTVLVSMIDRLNDTGMSLALLPVGHRVSSPRDWLVLGGHLRAIRRAGVRPEAPRSETLFERTHPRSRIREDVQGDPTR